MKRLLPLVALGAILALSLAAVTLVIHRSPALEATHGMPCGDLDGDGAVTMADLIIEVGYFHQDQWLNPPTNTIPNPAYRAQTDMNGDGLIRVNDILTVASALGTTTACQDKPIGSTSSTFAPVAMSLRVKSAGAFCDVPANPNQCTVPTGSPFTLSVDVTAAPAGGYVGFQTELTFGTLVYKPAAGAGDEIVWPASSLPFRLVSAQDVLHADASAVVPPMPVSTHTGNILDLQFNCPGPGAFKVAMPLYLPNITPFGTTFFTDNFATRVVPNLGESLTINCGAPSPTVLGALGVSGGTATLQAGGEVRFVCDPPDPNAPVAIRLFFDWGSQDITGTGRTTFTYTPPADTLNSVQCIVYGGVPGPALLIDWYDTLLNPTDVVVDSISGLPVLGATVTLLIEDPPTSGIYREVHPISDGVQPAINPETTGLDGRYSWTVPPGNYRVSISVLGIAGESLAGPAQLCTLVNPIVDPFAGGGVPVDCTNSDSDLLPDFAERITQSSPTNPDSNIFGPFSGWAGNSVKDDAEDPDGDGSNNIAELALGQDPLVPQTADSDADGCPDVQEVGSDHMAGGRRDPNNPYDYFDPTNDGLIRVNDILAVIGRYYSSGDPAGPLNTIPAAPPAYHPKFDRAPLAGQNVWNLTQGDGFIGIPDILAVMAQYFNDCGTGIVKV